MTRVDGAAATAPVAAVPCGQLAPAVLGEAVAVPTRYRFRLFNYWSAGYERIHLGSGNGSSIDFNAGSIKA